MSDSIKNIGEIHVCFSARTAGPLHVAWRLKEKARPTETIEFVANLPTEKIWVAHSAGQDYPVNGAH